MKNTKQNALLIHKFWINCLKTKCRDFFFSFQGGKGNHVKALDVYTVKALEVYTVKALEVYTVKALQVYTVKALEVYTANTRGVSLSNCSLEVINI